MYMYVTLGHVNIVTHLIVSRASIHIQDKKEQTALNVAEQAEHGRVLECFIDRDYLIKQHEKKLEREFHQTELQLLGQDMLAFHQEQSAAVAAQQDERDALVERLRIVCEGVFNSSQLKLTLFGSSSTGTITSITSITYSHTLTHLYTRMLRIHIS